MKIYIKDKNTGKIERVLKSAKSGREPFQDTISIMRRITEAMRQIGNPPSEQREGMEVHLRNIGASKGMFVKAIRDGEGWYIASVKKEKFIGGEKPVQVVLDEEQAEAVKDSLFKKSPAFGGVYEGHVDEFFDEDSSQTSRKKIRMGKRHQRR